VAQGKRKSSVPEEEIPAILSNDFVVLPVVSEEPVSKRTRSHFSGKIID
jgi:hypothetical protein